MPGVPDVYQGSELGEQSLVDPDNRRPVDFDLRAAAARRRPRRTRCAPKLLVTSTALRLRRDRPELFTDLRPGRGRRRRRRPRRSPSTAAARSPSPPGCRSGSRARGGWGDTTLGCRPAPGATCSTDWPTDGARRRRARAPTGVALLVKED